VTERGVSPSPKTSPSQTNENRVLKMMLFERGNKGVSMKNPLNNRCFAIYRLTKHHLPNYNTKNDVILIFQEELKKWK
jgi:hypothetical protein